MLNFIGRLATSSIRRPEKYKSYFVNNWYITGDRGWVDEDGYFWLLGRADEVLKIAGHRLGTAELEDAANSHPQVAEAAVTSRADPVKGGSIVLFVTLRDSVKPTPELKQDLVNHMRKVVGPIAMPDQVYFTSKLPKTKSGKIMRRVLKAVAEKANIGDLSTLEDADAVDEVIRSFSELEEHEKESV